LRINTCAVYGQTALETGYTHSSNIIILKCFTLWSFVSYDYKNFEQMLAMKMTALPCALGYFADNINAFLSWKIVLRWKLLYGKEMSTVEPNLP
jgi:hypothetical protein